MAKKFYESLIDYFLHIEKLHNVWHHVINALIQPIESLKNQSHKLYYVNSNTVDNAEICPIFFTRKKLIFKINTGIDDEIALIEHGVHTCRNLCQDLRNKFNYLTTLRNEIPESDPWMPELIRGSATRPQLTLLLKWVTRIYKYYSNYYNTINQNYLSLNRNDEETVEKFAFSLEEHDIEQSKVEKILATTQFFLNRTII